MKVIASAQRHPENRSLEDFHRYWAESHGPLVANTPGLRGYVQHLTLPEAYGGTAPTYDGVSMFVYDEPADQGVPSRGEADPREVALRHAVLEDDAQLFDRSTTWPMHEKRASVAAVERVILDGPTTPDMTKGVFIGSKLPGLTLLEFFHHWQHVHGPLVAAVPGVRRYVQNHAIPEAYAAGTQTHDGWAEIWFDDLAAMRVATATPGWVTAVEDGATLFAAPVGVGIAHERILKDEGWAPRDWGVGAMSDADIRARLAAQGYDALADDSTAPAAIRRAAETGALAVWTDEHLVTFDESRIDARPVRP
jgi:uncharacterized protein (TIGR02118 family)